MTPSWMADGLGGLSFGWPVALYALLLVPLLWMAIARGERRRERADRAYGGGDDLRIGRSPALRQGRALLLLLAMAVLIVGVARPQWGSHEMPVEQRGIDIVIAIDVSPSMWAEDVAPNRAAAAAEAVGRLIPHLHGNRVGLVIFGDSAFERAPLTLDVNVIPTLAARAQREAPLVARGSSLAVGLHAALDVLELREPAHAQVVVLISDGEDLSGRPLDSAIERAQERGVPIYGVFAASETPTPLPEARGGGTATADRAVLDSIASATGGHVREPANLAGLAVEFRRMRQTEFLGDTEAVPIERFPWFFGAGLALLVMQALLPESAGIRRARPRRGPVAAGGVAGLLLLVGCAGTAVWQEVDAGNRAHDAGDYEKALEHYTAALERDEVAENEALEVPLHYNVGNTFHEIGAYAQAVEASFTAHEMAGPDGELFTAARYALGNHFYRLGELEAARDSYVAVLRIDPGDRRAKENLELVLRQMPPPEDDEPDANGDDEGDENGEGENGNGDGEPQPGNNGDDGDPDPDGEPLPGENGESGDDGDAPPGGSQDEFPDDLEGRRDALRHALGEIGEQITVEQAMRLLELHRRVNELDPLGEQSFPFPRN